jgi:NAD dependent epimerase/dehydratase family enzyme
VNGVAPEPARNEELTRTLGRVLGRPTLLPVPAFAVRAALGDLSAELLGSKRVVPRRARELGFAFRQTSLEELLRSELA